jgi:short-subunit dehydrogenase
MSDPASPGTALITGASSGLGATFAHHLAALKYDLVLVARREDRLRTLAGQLSQRYGIGTDVLPADLSTDAGIFLVEERIRARGDMTLLVNNAGFGAGGRFWTVDPARQREMIRVHVEATARFTRAILPSMIERRRGAVINVGSVAAFFVLPGGVLYGSTKAWIVAFSKGLANELRGTGVHIQALCPGFTHTEFHDAPEFNKMRDSTIPGFLWSPADEVIEKSLRALGRRKTVYIPGVKNKILAAIPHIPFIGPLIRSVARRHE